MSSSRALGCLPSIKRQKHDSKFASLTEQVIGKIVEDKDTQHKKVGDGG